MDNALTAKAARRHALAKLPIEEKIRIIVEMQKLANEILVKTGRPARRVWE
jgi:ribosomal protein L16/L10AE